jgi:hypothetical protein
VLPTSSTAVQRALSRRSTLARPATLPSNSSPWATRPKEALLATLHSRQQDSTEGMVHHRQTTVRRLEPLLSSTVRQAWQRSLARVAQRRSSLWASTL